MTEPTLRRKFQYTDLTANNNKFWTVEYWPDGMMTTSWGRVGQRPQTSSKCVPCAEVEKLIREKERKGYVEVLLHAPQPVAAPDDEEVETAPVIDLRVQRFVEWVFREAMTRIEGYLAVEILTMSQAQIDKGRRLLREIQDSQKRKLRAAGREKVAQKVEDFYNAIPTKLPARIDREQIIAAFLQHLAEQEDRLNQLEAGLAVSRAQATNTNLTQLAALGGVQLKALEQSNNAYDQIAEYVNRTSSGGFCIHDIFSVHIPGERTAFENETRGKHNVVNLFHGTRSWNVRHILRSGLIIPDVAANGSRMGRGIYFADKARRSLNYTGSQSSSRRLLFIADVALGKPKKMDGIAMHLKAAPDGYDSVWGTGSWGGDDEFIVYKPSQQTIRALVTVE